MTPHKVNGTHVFIYNKVIQNAFKKKREKKHYKQLNFNNYGTIKFRNDGARYAYRIN